MGDLGAELVDLQRVGRIHNALRKVRVRLPADPEASELRALFSEIRDKRNAVASFLGWLLPLAGKLKAGMVRTERRLAATSAEIIDQQRGEFVAARNDRQVKARLSFMLKEEHDEKAAYEAAHAEVAECVAHARLVMDELRSAFEEASRSLASKDFELRVAGV